MSRQQSKDVQQKHQAILSRLLKEDDNKYCVDCDAKGPRWASWNLGVFLCIRCAGIHRNLGVHISKVKSINLDSWTPDQIASVEDMGNSRARAVYEANLPDHYKRPAASDQGMEQFIRAKYEHKKYIAKEWVPSKPRSVPSHYYDDDSSSKKEVKKPPKTVLTIPGAAAGTASSKSAKEEKKTPVKQAEPAPSLMVDLSTPTKQVNGSSAQKPQTSQDLLADIFSSPSLPTTANTSANNDLLGLSTNQQPPSATNGVSQSRGDASQDLFKVAEEKNQNAKDSIMALFGNTSSQQSMVNNSFNMQGSYMQPQQNQMMSSSQQGMNNMMGSYTMATQHQPGMMTSQQGMMTSQQGMMMGQPGMMTSQQGMMMGQPGMMTSQGYYQQQPQQMGMMGNQGMMGNTMQGSFGHSQQQMYAQQLQGQMANMSLNNQQMNSMPQQGTVGSAASWGNSSSQANGQTLNFDLWN